mmetsp:Transcript_65113/g.146874  ORF Transcript_65113/g.146874 Transcript_65113/m.146874 type:complete len:261 (+) Transcript_65113:196-978(+)
MAEGPVVHIGAEKHDELAIETVHHAPVAWDQVVEILDAISPLDRAREEAAKGSSKGREEAETQGVKLGAADFNVPKPGHQGRDEPAQHLHDRARLARHGLLGDGQEAPVHVHRARRARERLDGEGDLLRHARHPLQRAQLPGEPEGKDQGADRAPEEALPRLVGRELEELPAGELLAEELPAVVRHDVVADDKGAGQHEPEKAGIDDLEDRLRLEDHNADGHYSPGVLLELVLDHPLPQAQHRHYHETGVQREGYHHVLL